MRLFICVLVLCNVCLLESFVLPSSEDLYSLDIVHYNDFHDRFEETSIAYPVCKTNDTKCLGGFARLYQETMTLLEEKPDALLLNAGDVFQGTYWYTLLKWNVTQKFINMLPNDAHAIGNHEFDGGISGLVPYLAALHAPVVAANMDASKYPELNGLYKPHTIVERKGRKIGIIGLITPETKYSSNSGEVVFTDPVEAAQREAELLTKQGVDIIIVLSHCGLDVDKQIARTVGDNIDIIVGGHSHSLLWNGTAPSNEHPSGPYPVMIETGDKPGHKVLVVTASAFTKYLGNMTAYFDKSGELQSFEGVPVFLNRSIPEDPKMKALLQPYTQHLHELVQQIVGYTTDDLLVHTCGAGECYVGDMVAEGLLDATLQLNVSDRPHVAFLLRNMMRGSIGKGEITRGAIINMLPFTNKIVTFALPGRYLLQAFKQCLTNYWDERPFNGPWMPHVAGLKLHMNTTRGGVDGLQVWVNQGDDDDFQPLDMDEEYQVTTMQFLRRGGNGFQMLKQYGRDEIFVGIDTYLLMDYVPKVSPLVPHLDNRLTVVN